MATKTFYATRDLKNPSYGTRMLKAGEPVELDAPKARLYLALGAVSPEKPMGAARRTAADEIREDLAALRTPQTRPRTVRKRARKAKK